MSGREGGEEEDEESGGMAANKTRTPHRDVGNKKLLGTSASLLVTSALLVVTRCNKKLIETI